MTRDHALKFALTFLVALLPSWLFLSPAGVGFLPVVAVSAGAAALSCILMRAAVWIDPTSEVTF